MVNATFAAIFTHFRKYGSKYGIYRHVCFRFALEQTYVCNMFALCNFHVNPFFPVGPRCQLKKNRHTMCACVTAELFFGSYLLFTVAHSCHITKCSQQITNRSQQIQIAHSKLKSLTANSRVCLFVEDRGYFFECTFFRGYIVEGPYFTKGKPNYQIILMYIMHTM